MNIPTFSGLNFSTTAPRTQFINNAANASTIPTQYQSTPLTQFITDPTETLSQQNTLNVVDNFLRKDYVQIYPKEDAITSGIQNLRFEFVTDGWTRPSEYMVNLCFSTEGRSIAIEPLQDANLLDSPEVSTKIQAPFCLLNSLEQVEGFIGTQSHFDQTPDTIICRDIKAIKAIMCHNQRSKIDHEIAFTTGLPCQKSTFLAKFEDGEYTSKIDQALYITFAQSIFQREAVPFRNFYTCSLFLYDLFPFMKTDEKLFPPGMKFFFRLRFNASTEKLRFIYNGAKFAPMQDIYSYMDIDTTTQYPILNANGSTYITYRQWFPKTGIDNELKHFSKFIYNTWTYDLYKKTLLDNNQTINIHLPLKTAPSRIILYFTSPNDDAYTLRASEAANNTSQLFSDGNGYLIGYNIDRLKICFNGRNIFYIPTTQLSSTYPHVFMQNSSTYDMLMNKDDEQNFENNKSRIISQKLNAAIDNFIPHAFNLAPELLNTPSIRPIQDQMVDITMEIGFNHSFQYSTDGTTYSNYVNTLPIGTTINMLFQYGTQYIIDETLNLNYIRDPRTITDIESENQEPMIFNGD